jgi:hypothetical protein|tara:strand:- start:17768 stop:18121 length:354 start_codon:yes stop_codon:yes gene_type:complete
MMSASQGALMVVELLFFMLNQLPIEFVGKQVDGCVHILVFGIGNDLSPRYVQRGLGLLPEFFDLKDDLYGNDAVEMAFYPLEFLLDVVTQGFSDFKVKASDVDLHTASPIATCELTG